MVTAIELSDPPRRLRAGPTDDVGAVDLSARYGITSRLAREWITRLVAAGVVSKVGRLPMGRLSACDAWVAAGGPASMRKVRV